MDDHSLFPDQRDVLLAFLERGVRFLIVGGFAFSAHAFIRATKDVDLWVEPTAENAARVWRALAGYGAPLAAHNMTASDFHTPGLVYQMGDQPARVDVITSIADLDFGNAWTRRLEAELDGLQVPVLGLEDLIRAKEVADRKRDRLDVRALRRVQKRRGE